MKVKIEVSEPHIQLWERNDWRIAIIMGGRGNGRSGTASRYALSRLLGKEYTRGAIMRAVREDIRRSCWQEINDRLTEQNITEAFRIVDNDMHIERGANSLHAHGFKASSGSLTARLKSLAGYNFVWIEEAEEIGEQEFQTLNDTLRTVKGQIRIILTLNTPPKNHWIIKKWFDLEPVEGLPDFYLPKLKADADEVLYIPGTYRDNLPNLSPQTVKQYEAYKQTKPAYYWQVIEGYSPETARGRIYQGWRKIQSVPHEARLLGYGLDFGFDPDPAAIVAVYYHNGGYILDEKLYARELLNEHLATQIKLLPTAPIVADSAEPKSIAELVSRGISVVPCTKGKDSVNYGIKHVQGLRLSYTATSKNLEAEYENYVWKEDKEGNGLGIEDPNCENHLMSAARYFLTEMVKHDADPEAFERQEIAVEVHRREASQEQEQDYGL
jgi:phage terminase large subunit